MNALSCLPFTYDYARDEFEMKFCLLLDRGGAALIYQGQNRGPCWRWRGLRGNHGYGIQHFDGVGTLLMHRVAYEVFNGELEPGLVIRHLCHTRSCCNPQHLEQGSESENREDMYQRYDMTRPVGVV